MPRARDIPIVIDGFPVEVLNVSQILELIKGERDRYYSFFKEKGRIPTPTKVHYIVYRNDATSRNHFNTYSIGASLGDGKGWFSALGQLPWTLQIPVVIDWDDELDKNGERKTKHEPSCDGKIVEIEGRKYKLQEVK